MEIQFYQAAATGNLELMKSLLSQIDPFEAEPESLKTAAHWAAEKGHAAALRLLHSLGDTFMKKDSQGCTPEQLATDQECRNVFKLVRLAQKSLQAADAVFPERMDVLALNERIKADTQITHDKNYFIYREAANEICIKVSVNYTTEFGDLSINEYLASGRKTKELYDLRLDHTKQLPHLMEALAILLSWKGVSPRFGACGETTAIVFAYLTYISKTNFPVEYVTIPLDETIAITSKNHSFVILNRSQDPDLQKGLEQALIIDPLSRQSFFFENLDRAKSCITHTLLKKVSLNCSSRIIHPPKTPWPQTRTIVHWNSLLNYIEQETQKQFKDWGISSED